MAKVGYINIRGEKTKYILMDEKEFHKLNQQAYRYGERHKKDKKTVNALSKK
jgi:hypothetical protein